MRIQQAFGAAQNEGFGSTQREGSAEVIERSF
jgi:hypothetical protein